MPRAAISAGERMTDDQSFPRAYRLTKAEDYRRVYQRKVFATDQVLVVNACPNQLDVPRLGLSVSRKVGNAVLRNRWKRLIREAFRRHRGELPCGIDYVFRPRRGAAADFQAISASLPGLARRVAKRLAAQSRESSRDDE